MTIPFTEVAREVTGRRIHANTVALGALVAVLGMDLDMLKGVLGRIFSSKGQETVQANLKAADKGYHLAIRDCKDMCPWELPKINGRYYLISGNEAIPIAF